MIKLFYKKEYLKELELRRSREDCIDALTGYLNDANKAYQSESKLRAHAEKLNDSLSKNNIDLQEDLILANEKMSKLSEKIIVLEEHLRVANGAKGGLTAKNNAYEKEKGKLLEELHTITSLNVQLAEENKTLKEKVSLLEVELRELKIKTKTLDKKDYKVTKIKTGKTANTLKMGLKGSAASLSPVRKFITEEFRATSEVGGNEH